MYAVFVMYSDVLFDLRLGRLSAKALQIGGLVMVVSVSGTKSTLAALACQI